MSLSKLVSSLLEDSRSFLLLGRDALRKRENALVSTYSRAVFFSAWSAMEGWINYIAYSFAKTDTTLTPFELSFLIEKKIEVDENGRIQITNQDEYKPTLTKLVFLLRRFGNDFDIKHHSPDLWRRLKEIEQTRHSIVHPKTRDEELHLTIEDAENCLNTIVELINLLKEKIYEGK